MEEPDQHNQEYARRMYNHFLYKVLMVSIFLVVLSLLPSKAPDFLNQTLKTKGWEFLHVIFVGIAVSYGLFSRRNEEEREEAKGRSSKIEYAQSFISRSLQSSSSSGFEEDAERLPGANGEKSEAWSSQYYRKDPVAVVTEDKSATSVETVTGEIMYPAPSPWKSLASKMELEEIAPDEKLKFSQPTVHRNSTCPKRFDSFSMETHSNLAEDGAKTMIITPPTPPRPPHFPPKSVRKSVSLESSHSPYEEDDFTRNELRRNISRDINRQADLSSPASFRTWQSDRKETYAEEAEKNEKTWQTHSSTSSINQNYSNFLDEKGSVTESEEESRSDEEESQSEVETATAQSPSSKSVYPANDDGQDVDKKADEFIARFREQIRLQRIESIKRFTGQGTAKTIR